MSTNTKPIAARTAGGKRKDYYLVVGGKPNGEFNVPTKSKRFQKLMNLSNKELQEQYPHMRGSAIPEMGITKAMSKKMTHTFNAQGEVMTEDETVARYAEAAAKSNPMKDAYHVGVHPHSPLQITDTSPLYGEGDEEEDEEEDDEEETKEEETSKAPAKNKGGRGKKSEDTSEETDAE